MDSKVFKNSEKSKELYSKYPFPNHPGVINGVQRNCERYLKKIINKKINILVLGCGTGEEALGISKAFKKASKITAIEPCKESYSIAKILLKGEKKINLIHSDIEFFANNNKKLWDFIWCSGVLHHTEKPLNNLRLINGLLEENGNFLLSMYHHSHNRILFTSDTVFPDENNSKYSKAQIMDNTSHPIEITKNWKSYKEFINKGGFKIMNVLQKINMPAPIGPLEFLYEMIWKLRKIEMMRVLLCKK